MKPDALREPEAKPKIRNVAQLIAELQQYPGNLNVGILLNQSVDVLEVTDSVDGIVLVPKVR